MTEFIFLLVLLFRVTFLQYTSLHLDCIWNLCPSIGVTKFVVHMIKVDQHVYSLISAKLGKLGCRHTASMLEHYVVAKRTKRVCKRPRFLCPRCEVV